VGSTPISLGSTVTSINGLTLSNPTINGATITGSLIPNADITYDLGDTTHRFRDLYLSGSTIKLGATTISANGLGLTLSGSAVVTVDDIGTVTDKMVALGSIANDKLAHNAVTITAGTG